MVINREERTELADEDPMSHWRRKVDERGITSSEPGGMEVCRLRGRWI